MAQRERAVTPELAHQAEVPGSRIRRHAQEGLRPQPHRLPDGGAGGGVLSRLLLRADARAGHLVQAIHAGPRHPGQPVGGSQVLRGLLSVLLRVPHHSQHDPAQRPQPRLGIPCADHPGAPDQRGARNPVQARRAEPYLPPPLHLPGGGRRTAAGVLARRRPVQRPARLVRRGADSLLSGSPLLSRLLHQQRHLAGDRLGEASSIWRRCRRSTRSSTKPPPSTAPIGSGSSFASRCHPSLPRSSSC